MYRNWIASSWVGCRSFLDRWLLIHLWTMTIFQSFQTRTEIKQQGMFTRFNNFAQNLRIVVSTWTGKWSKYSKLHTGNGHMNVDTLQSGLRYAIRSYLKKHDNVQWFFQGAKIERNLRNIREFWWIWYKMLKAFVQSNSLLFQTHIFTAKLLVQITENLRAYFGRKISLWASRSWQYLGKPMPKWPVGLEIARISGAQ